LNEDLSREYQAIIAEVVYSQALSGAQYMDIAAQTSKSSPSRSSIVSRQVDDVGKTPAVTPKPVRTSKNPKDTFGYDLDNENETVRDYRDRQTYNEPNTPPGRLYNFSTVASSGISVLDLAAELSRQTGWHICRRC